MSDEHAALDTAVAVQAPRAPNWFNEAQAVLGRLDKSVDQKRNAKTAAKVLKALADGLPVTTACGLARIHRNLWDRWKTDEPRLAELEEYALARAEADDFASIRSNKDWRAPQWIMGLRRAEYAPSTNGSHNGPSIQISINMPKPEPVGPEPVTIEAEAL